jgi:tRNA(Ile)-lysidine synthase
MLHSNWLSRFAQFKQLIVAYSGGLDSTVLLHLLTSVPHLRTKILAVHVHHGLSTNATSWQAHCAQWCQQLNIAFHTESVTFDRTANVEERARKARYAVFSSLVKEKDCLLLGHHQDDQAETVLLQLFRGAGVDGLAAMPEQSAFGLGILARPLLSYSRAQLEHYALQHQLTWIEDESNQDIAYSRNYLRQQIMPMVLAKWPGAVGNISRTATHCQQAKSNLDALATMDYQQFDLTKEVLELEPLCSLNFERITNVLRVWLKNNQVSLPTTATFHRLIHEMISARTDAAPEVSWGDIIVRRFQNRLYLTQKSTVDLPSTIDWSQFPRALVLNETGLQLSAQQSTSGLVIPLDAKVVVKFRQGGEVFFFHGQHKHLKKLFQEWNVPPWVRDQTPLIYINNVLAMVVGYAISDLFFKHHPEQSERSPMSGTFNITIDINRSIQDLMQPRDDVAY